MLRNFFLSNKSKFIKYINKDGVENQTVHLCFWILSYNLIGSFMSSDGINNKVLTSSILLYKSNMEL